MFPDWKTLSPKADELNKVLLSKTSGKIHDLIADLISDEEILHYHNYANAVSVRRLGYNDHGAVHARITTYTCTKLLNLLHESGIQTSLEREEIAGFEDSSFAVILGCFLHDTGMGVCRSKHEWHSINLVDHIIQRYIAKYYPQDFALQIVLRALVHEVIVGHMAETRIHSIEAGIVLIADGLDMSRGRSRIPTMIERDPMVGDIHRFSATAIQRVKVEKGENKPIRITISMENSTGLFQVEEVLMTKVKASPVMPYLEIAAQIGDATPRLYLR